MKSINDYKPGDIILVSNNGLLPKGIKLFMNIYRKKKDVSKTELYNHVVVVVNLWGKMWIADSAEKGVQVNESLEKYVNRENCLHLTWKTPLTEEEQELFSKTAINYSLNPTRYDFINFYDQIRYILTGKWKGKTGDKSKKRLYCSEFAAVCMDVVRNSFKGVTWDKNPLDIQLCEDLVVVK